MVAWICTAAVECQRGNVSGVGGKRHRCPEYLEETSENASDICGTKISGEGVCRRIGGVANFFLAVSLWCLGAEAVEQRLEMKPEGPKEGAGCIRQIV
jgi:hypothetical protein